jgi:hypothetical protein
LDEEGFTMTTHRGLSVALLVGLAIVLAGAGGEDPAVTHPYEAFDPDTLCAECHVDIARQHEQAMMSQSFVHHWDEVEYFELALPHARKEPKVAGVEAGCNGCHAPLAFLAGDIPPQRPEAGTRANEGVSCDLCHSITGFDGELPFNFNFVVDPGDAQQGSRTGVGSPAHEVVHNPFLGTAEFCATCHNEQDPYGQWVKATHLEWRDSPQAAAGIVCQDCHMPPAPGNPAPDAGGLDRPDVRQHLFHGAHDTGKLQGAVEVRIHPTERRVRAGSKVTLAATVVNAKAGHMIPTGSAEERVVWLHVEATDASGEVHHLAVDPRGFEGERLTIADPDARAYFALGEIRGIDGFEGLARDGQVPAGDRIFRLPYLDPKGRMTVCQWYTASFGPDVRLAPLRGITETFTWTLPDDLPAGPVDVTATVWYSRLVSSVARELGIPDEEWAPVLMGTHSTQFEVRIPVG